MDSPAPNILRQQKKTLRAVMWQGLFLLSGSLVEDFALLIQSYR